MKKFDNVSFSAEGYEKFVTLSKDEQVKKLGGLLSPKSEDRAKQLLTHIPYANNSNADAKKTASDNRTSTTAGDAQDNNARPTTATGKGKGVQTGGETE
jgi:hypothetical protein